MGKVNANKPTYIHTHSIYKESQFSKSLAVLSLTRNANTERCNTQLKLTCRECEGSYKHINISSCLLSTPLHGYGAYDCAPLASVY